MESSGETVSMRGSLSNFATSCSGTLPPGRIRTRSARPEINSMLRLKESSDAWMESLTLVNTAAPSAIPTSTVSARPGCFRRLRKLNQTKNLKKKNMRCTVYSDTIPSFKLILTVARGSARELWVAMITVRFHLRFNCANKSTTICPFRLSKFPVGSSAIIMSGSLINALAIAVRCISPPESWAGR